MSENKFIIFDIDGTLSDCTHRAPLAQSKLWDEFYERCTEDPVIVKVADLMMHMACSSLCSIMLLTGRPEKLRHKTVKWLTEAKLEGLYDELIMRPDQNYEIDAKLKIKLLEERFGGKDNVLERVWFAVDDRDQVVEAFRNYGITTFQCAAGGF